MAPKKIDPKAKATSGYADGEGQPDTASDELIAHLIAEMEKVSIKDVSKDKMEEFAKMASKTVKAWNNRAKPSKEEKEALRKQKALERAEEKKKATAEKRGQVFTIQIEFDGEMYEVEVMAGDTVADIRLEFVKAVSKKLKLKKKDISRLRFFLGDVCLNDHARKELVNHGVCDGSVLRCSLADPAPKKSKAAASTDTVSLADDDDEDEETDGEDVSDDD